MKITDIFQKRFFLLYFSLAVLVIFCGTANSEGPVQLKTRAWPTKAAIGDEIKLTVQVERPKNFSIVAPSPKTPIAPFEIKSVEVSSYIEEAQAVRQTFLLKVTVFQLGDLQIPPIPVTFTDPRGREGQVWTEPVKIKVSSVLKEAKDKADIRPIKGPVSLDTRTFWTVVFSVLALILKVFLITKIILRRRNKKPIDPEAFKPAHERALLELGRLEAKEFLKAGKEKEFYSELADILRRYLDRRFEMETLEFTTFEILRELKIKEFDSSLAEKIREFLEYSDLVKFAKLIPPRSAADRTTGLLKQIVEETAPKEEELKK